MVLKLIDAPATEPVTAADIKRQAKIEHADDDARLEAFITAERSYAERFLGRALIDQTWDLCLDEFPDDEIEIPLPPLIEVEGVFYRDSNGDEQEFEAFDVDTISEPARLFLPSSGSWPTPVDEPNAVRIRFRAGYLNSDSPPVANVPEDIKFAILLRVEADYDAADQSDLKRDIADRLLRLHRIEKSMA